MLGSAILGSLSCAPACLAQASGANSSADMLNYSVSASESLIFGYNGVSGPSSSFNISGNAGYVSGSERHPLSFVYSGGYSFGNNNQPSASFQTLGVSQVLTTRRWTFLATDVVSYLPVSSLYGLAGIPGVGDIGTAPIGTGVVPGDALLTNFGRRITNTVLGGATVQLSAHDSLRNSASYTKQHFLDGNGIENDQFTAGSELDHTFSQSTTAGVGYTYARSMYPQNNFSFVSQSLVGIYQYRFNPRFNIFASAGPQWTHGSNTTLVPSGLGVSIGAGATYLLGRNTFSANFNHGTSTGSGVLAGALTNNLGVNAQHTFSDRWSGGLFASFGTAKTLAAVSSGLYTNATSVAVGVQTNRRFGQHWSVFGSYAAQYQDVGQLLLADNAFSGTAHVISFGVTYSPRPIHLGRR
jgi:hypothetical protein